MVMNLNKRLTKIESSVMGEIAGRPTANDLWYYRLEDVVSSVVEHAPKHLEPTGKYDHFFLYAHRDTLKSREDVRRAPDDVLLEALGLSDVRHLGWLQFMIRDLSWHEMLAKNWGLPYLNVGEDTKWSETTGDERAARAAYYFIELMRERGCDPLEQLREIAQAYMVQHKIPESEFIQLLRANNEWSYYIYTCESFVISPEVMGTYNEPAYKADFGVPFLAKIKEIADRRRRLAAAEPT